MTAGFLSETLQTVKQLSFWWGRKYWRWRGGGEEPVNLKFYTQEKYISKVKVFCQIHKKNVASKPTLQENVKGHLSNRKKEKNPD